MGIKSRVIPVFVVALLVVSAIAGTVFYYSGEVNAGNAKIELMKTNIANLIQESINLNNEITNQSNQIANLNSQIANLTGQISNLKSQQANIDSPSADLVTSLGISEIPVNSTYNLGNSAPFNHLYISGTVTNSGDGTAYNAGLHVVAYTTTGTVEVNMTVPLSDGGSFGADVQTQVYGTSSLQLGNLYPGQTTTVSLAIFHEATVSSWSLTPVSTNSP